MKIAIVHDYLTQNGGAEKTLEAIHEVFPDAPIYTSIFNPSALPPYFGQWDIRTSFLQKISYARTHHQPFLPLYPFSFLSFDLEDYDLVISFSSGFCHGIRVNKNTIHINYCMTPPRFLWDQERYLERETLGPFARLAIRPLLYSLKKWDAASVNGVDHFLSISRAVESRIERFYHRQVEAVLYPPVDVERFHHTSEPGEYYLIVSRLVPYKKVDLAVRAFNQLGLPLLIAGTGRDMEPLKGMAKANIKFLGWVDDEGLSGLYANCKALIFPGEEDFGIVPVEAQASGRPVVAYAAGGALETVTEGVTGTFFKEPVPEALAEAVVRIDDLSFDPVAIRSHAEKFDTKVFKSNLMEIVSRLTTGRFTPSGTA
ncbi:MAG: glycosyltransferase family 4 protein [Dehalococcoidia bacterium]|nr:glycosyltransferase family 4 protein [Dehalococcoidia bacterium]